MAVRSYLQEHAGGRVAAAAFLTPDVALEAVRMLRGIGIRWQEIAVIAYDEAVAARIAKDGGAWAPAHRLGPLPILSLPKSIGSRYSSPLDQGAVVLVVAEDGQKVETLAAVLEQARGGRVHTWWQEPAGIFPPPEAGGPL
jgi:hypothetical protein